MSWRDQLRQATLGSAPFLVESSDGELGRNTQLHEYPLRDKPYVEDLGRKARRFTLNAYVIGPEYMAARDALVAEIESAGPKKLIHPYLGELTVSVVNATGPSESTREGGMARFTITVIESGERLFPSAETATRDASTAAAAACTQAVAVDFSTGFAVGGQPAFVRQNAAARVDAFSARLRTLTAQITTLPAGLVQFAGSLNELISSAADLVLSPVTLAGHITSLFEQMRLAAAEPAAALAILRSFFRFGDDAEPVVGTTAARQLEAANQAAFHTLVRGAAIAQAVHVISTMDFTSYDDAVLVRDELLEEIELLADDAPDSVYTALVDVRVALVRDIGMRAANLARVVSITLPETEPALVVAHRLYRDAARADEIVARNRVEHPLFVPSGVELEVLTDG